MSDIKVSICCLVYNHAPYIRKCLDGFLMQECDFGFEVLIHDDASTDGTAEIIKEYQKKYPDIIKPVIQKENQYSKGVRNISVKYNFSRAKGRYIAMCEGDDYWTDPYKLQKQVNFMDAHLDVALTFHDRSIINDKDEVKEVKLFNIKNADKTIAKNIIHQFTPTLTMMFKTSALQDYFNINLVKAKVFGGDAFLRAYLSTKGKIVYLNFNGAVYRMHRGGVHNSLSLISKKEKAIETRLSVIKYIEGVNKRDVYKSILKFCFVIMRDSLKESQYGVCFKYLIKTINFSFKYIFII
jgi:glycosyltransferase involved in cell wall biosynthesis